MLRPPILLCEPSRAVWKADLQSWYHVEKLTPTELQQRYLEEHGVFANRAALVRWLKGPAQKLQQLDSNECIHSHACGEYVLDDSAAWRGGYRRRRRAAAEVSRRGNGSARGSVSTVSRAERRVLDGQGLGARALASIV